MLKKFPAKVLLLGEYTILNGSRALALPYPELTGSWSFEDNNSEDRKVSRESLQGFLSHVPGDLLDLKKLEDDFDKGLWFQSSIPHGFGLGSSGALIAAIYDGYSRHQKNDLEGKAILAKLESYFHGSRSGLDPFVSLVQNPLLIRSFEDVEVLNRPVSLKGFFLVNTGKPRQTGPLVAIYQEKMKDPEFKKGCADVLSRDVNLAVDAVISGNMQSLFHHLWHISKFQWDFFPEMIPTQMRGVWTRGIESGDYVLKLCGAGGGGYLLGYSEKLPLGRIQELFAGFEIRDLAKN
jgi:mevalonate kinase